MELNQMIKQLLDSGIIENQALGVTLLSSNELTKEEKKQHIDKFISDYSEGRVDFFNEEHKDIFKAWVDLYLTTVKEDVATRVKPIK